MRIARVVAIGCLMLGLAWPAWGQGRTADDAAIEKLYNDFFEALRQAGAQGAVGYLRQSGTISESDLRQLQQEAQAVLEHNPTVGRPDSWAVVNKTEVAGAPRYRAVYALTHHEGRPVAWRLRFYQRVTGVWVFTDVQWEARFVEDFLHLPAIQFAAYRKLLEGEKE